MKRTGLLVCIIFIISHHTAQGSYNKTPSEVNSVSSGGYLFTEVKGDLFTVDIRDITLEKVLKDLSSKLGIKFLLPPSLGEEKVMVRFFNYKIDEGLNKILASYNRILIYYEESYTPDAPPTTRLKEVKIYAKYHNNKRTAEGKRTINETTVTSKNVEDSQQPSQRYSHTTEISEKGKDENLVKTLSSDLKNKDPQVRLAAVKKLSALNYESSFNPLMKASKDSDPGVRKEAKKALEEIENLLNEESGFNSQSDPTTDTDDQEPPPSEGANPAFDIALDNTGTSNIGKEVDVNIRLGELSEDLITAGFSINYDPSKVSIVGVDVYDGSVLQGPWDRLMTKKNQDAPGTYKVTCGNLGNVALDSENGVNLAKVRMVRKDMGDTPITISTIEGFSTVVGNKGYVYDSNIKTSTFTFR